MKSEAQTRQEIIDKKLKEAGWDVKNLSQVSQEFDILVSLPSGVTEARTPFEIHRTVRNSILKTTPKAQVAKNKPLNSI